MINNMKGKEHIHRSLKVRIIAFITAFAMVLSVIYFNNRKDVVEADTIETVDATDYYYLKNLYQHATSLEDVGDVTVYVPANGLKINIPYGETGIQDADKTLEVYYNTSEDKYYIDAAQADPGAEKTEAYFYYNLKYCTDDAGTTERTANMVSDASGDTVYLVRTDARYSTTSSDTITIADLDASVLANEKVGSITVVAYDPAFTFDATTDPVTYSDTELIDSDTEKYYGDVVYEVTKDSVTNTYSSVSEVAALFNQGAASDGEYVINKIITKTVNEGSFTVGSVFSGTVNNYLLTSYKAAYFAGSSTPTEIDGDMDLKPNYALTVPASGTMSASNDVKVTFTTDVALDPATDITVTSPAGGVAATAVTKDASSNEYSFVINCDPELTNGKSLTYNVSMTDSLNLTEAFDVTLNFADGKPVFSNEKIGSDAVSSAFVYVKDNTTPLGATVTVADTAATLDEDVEVYRVSGSSPSGSAAATTTCSGGTISYDASGIMQPGENKFVMRAYTKYDAATSRLYGDSALFKVFYDDTDPYVEDNSVSITSGTTPVAVTHESGTKAYETTVTAMEDTLIEFYVGDMQKDGSGSDIDGSGIESVTVDGTSVTPDSTGYCSYTVSADTGKASGGGSKDVQIALKDKAGREDTYTVTVKYIDEDAQITEGFSPNSFVDGSNFFKWDGANKTATVTYTIKTNVELKDAADDGIVINVDETSSTIPDSDVKETTLSGDTYKYQYVFTYTYPSVTKADYKIKVKVTNVNGHTSPEHQTEVKSIDLTDPTINVDNTDSDWHRVLVLNVSVDDGAVTSGFDHVDATGVDSAKYTSNPFSATVNKSTSTAGTGVTFKAYDKAGNESAKFEHTYYIDQKDPELTLRVNKQDYTKVDGKVLPVADPLIEYTLTDDLSGIDGSDTTASYFKINGTSYPGSSGKKLSEIVGSVNPSLDYHIELYARDRVGNEKKYETTFRADGAKPDITGKIENTPKKDKYPTCFNENVTLTVTVKDANISRNGLKIEEINGHAIKYDWKDAGNNTWIATIKATNEGQYKVKVTATDDGGLTNTWEKAFIIDKTAPEVTTLLNGSEYTSSNSYNNTITTGVTVVDTNEDESDVIVQIDRDVPGDGSESLTKKGKGPFTISEDGFYKVTYTVTDKAGNTTTKEIGFTVDNTAPANNLYVTTANPAKVDAYPNNYVNVLYVFTEHDSQENYRYGQYYNTDVTIELNYYDYNLNSVYVTDGDTELSPSWTVNGPYGKATVTISSEGYHDIKIWTDDLSGNTTDDTDIGKRIRFTIDKTAPVISTTLNGAGYTEGSGVRYLTTNGTVGVTVSDTNEDASDLKRIYTMTPPGGSAKRSEAYVSEGSETYAEEADYEVQYVAVDKAGNTSSLRTVQFRVDKTAPQLSIGGVGTASTAGSVNISFNVKESFYWDMNNVTIKIYKKKDGSGETLEKTIDMKPKSANDSTSYTFTDDAEYRIEFTAEDKCGNKSNTDYTFIKDGTAPRIVLSGVGNYDMTDKNVELMVTVDEDFYTTNKVTLKGTRTDIDGKKNPITFNDFNPNRTKISEMKQLFDKDGIYDIEVTSTDRAGNSSSKKVHFTIDTEAPKIGDLSKYDGVKLREFKWDIDLDKLVTDLTVCDISLYLDGVEYDGVSPIEDGSHVLKVVAVDEMGHKSEKEVSFILDSKGPNIIVSNVEDQDLFYEARDISVSVQLDEDTLDNVKLNGKDVAVTDNQASMSIDKKGEYTLEAMAHDEAGNESSIKISFEFGSETNIWLIIGIAGGIILLLLILLLIIRKKKSW